jgi:hypothetical protein
MEITAGRTYFRSASSISALPTAGFSPDYSGMQCGTIFSLILGRSTTSEGNFSPAYGEQYEKLNPLEYSPTLHFSHGAVKVYE